MSLISRFFPELTEPLTRSVFGRPLLAHAHRAQLPAATAQMLSNHPLFASDPFTAAFQGLQSQLDRSPAINVRENDKAFVIEAELPGIARDKLSCEFVDPTTLSICGSYETETITQPQSYQAAEQSQLNTKESEALDATMTQQSPSQVPTATSSDLKDMSTQSTQRQQPQEIVWANERFTGSFRRTISFPIPVAVDKVSASLKDGLLRVEVPKEIVTKTSRIEIQ